MKTTKMIVVALCGIAMLAGASSCKKEKPKTEGEEMRIEALIGEADGDAKTHLEGPSVIWDSRDAFTLYSGTNGEVFIISPKEAGSTTATFIGFSPGKAPYYACYPSNATREADGFTFTVDKDQSGNMADIATVNAGPMAAYYTGEGNLVFKNAMSWLNIGLKGNAVVKKMVLTDKSAGAILNGKMTVKMDEDAITQWTMADGDNTLFLESEEGFQLHDGTTDDAYTWFRFLVPVNSFKENDAVEIKVYGVDPSTPIKTYTKTLQYSDAQGDHLGVEENKIYSPKVSESLVFDAPTVTLVDECVNCKQSISGKVTVTGSAQYCEYGIVYSKTETQPEIGKPGCVKLMANAESISGNKDFSVDLAPLNDGPYYVRTYVITGASSYSSDVAFLDTPNAWPSEWVAEGHSPYLYTVGAGKQVYFSRGNLQYLGSTNTWRFADHQFDVADGRTANLHVTSDYVEGSSNWIDLFGWGTSGWNYSGAHAICYQPWSTDKAYDHYYPYGKPTWNLYDGIGTDRGKADWGVANTIHTGSHATNGWRTLKGESNGEWDYLLTKRDNANNLYGLATIGQCIHGLVILPDNWDKPASVTFVPGNYSGYNTNSYTFSQWTTMEAAGAVFLPAAGVREVNKISWVGTIGHYWSSTHVALTDIQDGASEMQFKEERIYPYASPVRSYGYSVRLVKDPN